MITIRKSADRGHASHGWLDTHHSFSFADYRDPRHMGFRDLLVINEDIIQPQGGFGEHSHRDMEIITYVLSGQLTHKDSMGNGSIIKAGDVQRMSAGTGVSHSEVNPSSEEAVHLLQIWLLPREQGISPSYSQQSVSRESKHNKLKLIVSGNEDADSQVMHQDAQVYATVLEAGKKLEYELLPHRNAWIQVVSGGLLANGVSLEAGDGASFTDENRLTFEAASVAEFLLFDLA